MTSGLKQQYEIRKKLALFPALKKISQEYLWEIAENSHILTPKAGQLLYNMGDIADSLYFIVKGQVELHTNSSIQEKDGQAVNMDKRMTSGITIRSYHGTNPQNIKILGPYECLGFDVANGSMSASIDNIRKEAAMCRGTACLLYKISLITFRAISAQAIGKLNTKYSATEPRNAPEENSIEMPDDRSTTIQSFKASDSKERLVCSHGRQKSLTQTKTVFSNVPPNPLHQVNINLEVPNYYIKPPSAGPCYSDSKSMSKYARNKGSMERLSLSGKPSKKQNNSFSIKVMAKPLKLKEWESQNGFVNNLLVGRAKKLMKRQLNQQLKVEQLTSSMYDRKQRML